MGLCQSAPQQGHKLSSGGGGGGGGVGYKSSSPTSHPQSDYSSASGGGASSTPTDPRDAVRMAALARADKMLPHLEKAAKEEMVGKLIELYRRRGDGPPFNLASLPLARLRELYVSMGGKP